MRGGSMDHTNDLQEIAEMLENIKYGELHIIVRKGQIISYTTIKSQFALKSKKEKRTL